MTQGALVAALSLFMMGAAQQQQQQTIPDAPAPAASPTTPGLTDLKDQVAPGTGTTPDAAQSGQTQNAPQGQSSSAGGTGQTPAADEQDNAQKTPPQSFGSQQDQSAFLIRVPVNYISVPVRVWDKHHQMVAGLQARQFRIFEDGAPQNIATFSVTPQALSVAFVIDQTLPSDVMKKVNESLAAVTGAFAPYDSMAVITYNTSPELVTTFTGVRGARLPAALQSAQRPGRDMGMPMVTGPMAAGISINGNTPDPNLAPQRGNMSGFLVAPKDTHPLNDAILFAARELSRQPRDRRRVIYVIGDGKDARSKVTQKEVLKFLLTNNISVYGTLVGDSATWGIGYLDKMRVPLLATDNVLPRYATFTGGYLEAQLSENGIQKSFADIAASLRSDYLLGYYSHAPALSEKHHTIEVDVKVPGMDVYAKEGYYPSLSNVSQ